MIKRALTIFTGGVIGLMAGAIFGIAIGWTLDLILEPTYD